MEGPTFQPGGTSVLRWRYEGNSEFVEVPVHGIIEQSLVFSEVAAYRCAFDVLCGTELITLAYDKLVDLGETRWLETLRAASKEVRFSATKSLKHLAIFFDQGPCYEIVCAEVSIAEKLMPMPFE